MDIGDLDFDASGALHAPQLSSSFPPPSGSGFLSSWEAERRKPRRKLAKDEVRKAMLVLGLNLSDEKLMDTLGVDEETLKQAKETAEQARVEVEIKMKMRPPPNRDGLRKAFQVLGEDPSRKKIMDKFGIDEVQLYDVEKEVHQMRWEHPDISEARQSFIYNKKDYKKALSVLGYDPSAEKLMRIYGFDPDELQTARRESSTYFPSAVTGGNSTSLSVPDKLAARKALEVLGLDLTKEKLLNLYGLDEEEVVQATTYRQNLLEEKFLEAGAQRKRLHVPNRTETKKALEVLGEDPSDRKIMDKLGVCREGLEIAKIEAEKQRIEQFIESQKKDLVEKASDKALWVLGEKLTDDQPNAQTETLEVLSPTEEARLRHIPDKKNCSKAIAVLGIDTKGKIADKLGLSGDELRQAELEARRAPEIEEDGIAALLKKTALSVLGY